MGGGAVAAVNSFDAERCKLYTGRTTPAVILIAMVAASGGLLFGFDNGEDPAACWTAVLLYQQHIRQSTAHAFLCAYKGARSVHSRAVCCLSCASQVRQCVCC
jgi:hypothetical protein